MKSRDLSNDDTLSNFAQEYIDCMMDMSGRAPGRYIYRQYDSYMYLWARLHQRWYVNHRH